MVSEFGPTGVSFVVAVAGVLIETSSSITGLLTSLVSTSGRATASLGSSGVSITTGAGGAGGIVKKFPSFPNLVHLSAFILYSFRNMKDMPYYHTVQSGKSTINNL
jgi:hypothetical protein